MNTLIICNTSYQLLVALWIKYKYLNNEIVDVLITDHFKDSNKLVQPVKDSKLFKNVYYARTLDISRNRKKYSRVNRSLQMLFPINFLETIVSIEKNYDRLFLANFDTFSQIIYNALNRYNSDLKLCMYEEGLSTYSSFEIDYRNNKFIYGEQKSGISKLIHKHIYKSKTIYGNIDKVYLFNPDLMKWNPEAAIFRMEKIQCEDSLFKSIVNNVYGFHIEENEYTTKYIFFEESFLAEGTEINDIELVHDIAKRIGKDNIMIKIHPRNMENRFGKLGYKTNINTYIPWEVVLMNMDNLSEKVFITIASACILNPFLTFDRKVKAFSLYYCMNKVPPILQNGLWDLVEELYKKNKDYITICHSVEEVV